MDSTSTDSQVVRITAEAVEVLEKFIQAQEYKPSKTEVVSKVIIDNLKTETKPQNKKSK